MRSSRPRRPSLASTRWRWLSTVFTVAVLGAGGEGVAASSSEVVVRDPR